MFNWDISYIELNMESGHRKRWGRRRRRWREGSGGGKDLLGQKISLSSWNCTHFYGHKNVLKKKKDFQKGLQVSICSFVPFSSWTWYPIATSILPLCLPLRLVHPLDYGLAIQLQALALGSVYGSQLGPRKSPLRKHSCHPGLPSHVHWGPGWTGDTHLSVSCWYGRLGPTGEGWCRTSKARLTF